MRFYECDGSCRMSREDEEFGWWLGWDAPSEEDLVELVQQSTRLFVERLEPTVQVHFPVRVLTPQMRPEGSVAADDELALFDLGARPGETDGINFVKEKIVKMIPCDTLKGGLLISLVDSPRFGMSHQPPSQQRDDNVPELAAGTPDFCSKGRPLRATRRFSKKARSLLEEIFSWNDLLGARSARLIAVVDSSQHLKTSEKLDCLPLDRLQVSEKESCCGKFLECAALLSQNLRSLRENIWKMRREILHIRMDFQAEDRRTLRLLRESKKLSRELRESNYLNEVLLLLMGQAEKIKSDHWPFKICSNRREELNLVI